SLWLLPARRRRTLGRRSCSADRGEQRLAGASAVGTSTTGTGSSRCPCLGPPAITKEKAALSVQTAHVVGAAGSGIRAGGAQAVAAAESAARIQLEEVGAGGDAGDVVLGAAAHA